MTKQQKTYSQSVHTMGLRWILAAMIVLLSVPAAISIYYNAWPPLSKLLAGYLPILAIYGPVSFIEVLTYTPMLGTGGTYLGFVTGNLTSLKVPCALTAMENAGVKPGTEKGEVISTIAIGTSSLVTNLILLAGVLLFTQVQPFLESPAIRPAFDHILPALFGGLGVVFISRNWKVAVVPIIVMGAVFILAPGAPIALLIPVAAGIAIGAARILYKKKLI